MTASSVAYWISQLRDLPPTLELPIENPSADASSLVARAELGLGEALASAIDRVAGEEYVSPMEVLLAAYVTLLYRYSHEEAFAVGMLSATEPPIVVRAVVAANPPFGELVGQVYNTVASAAFARDVAFEELVEALAAARTDGKHPIFQFAFTFGDDREEGASTIAADTTAYDLVLGVRRTAGDLICQIDYNVARYDRDAIERMLGHYRALLQGVVTSSTTQVDQLPLLSAAERTQILIDWNDTTRPYPADRCLHELVERHVDRAPDAIAVILDGEQLTYRELETRANQLAHQLLALGAGPDVRIGLFVERTIEMVIGVLAILKAGAAYVPLETKSPPDRIAFVLADASVPVLITQDRLVAQLGELVTHIVRIDADWPEIARHPITRPAHGARSDNLAYVIYTSGSTGRPKGVLIEHRMIVNLVTAAGALEQVKPGDRMLQFSSVAFDSSVDELFTPLAHGATLVLRGEDVPSAADLFGERFAGVTVMNIPTAYWHALAAALKVSALVPPPALRLVNIGGERAQPELVRVWAQLAPGCTLNNFYGPTEATVMATGWRLAPEQLRPRQEVPIGVPLANYTIYLLDARREPVPVGIPGEIYIGGVSVARGYLDRPELTAEKFVANPFGPGRLYRTGDLARWHADGNLEFKGRADDQVKIRGFRIELGEIEGALSALPYVDECAVIAREDQRGEKRLVAYLIGDPTTRPTTAEIRGQLGATLPDYMIPAVVWIEQLPVTATGKLDHKALPAPDDAVARSAFQAPQGDLEDKVAAIWCELLGVERVGRHDNFFELGGHSLLAVQLMERLRQLGLASDALFSAPTLADLAATLGSYREIEVPANLIDPDCTRITPDLLPLISLDQADIDRIVAQVPGGVANIQDIYALSPLQEGFLFHHQLSQDDPYLHVLHMTFPDRALLDRYLEAMQQVMDRHDILRTGFIWERQSIPAQVVWRKAHLNVTEVQLDPDGPPGHEQLLRRFDPHRYNMDLTQASLMHFVIARDPESERWLFYQLAHHLIGDHESPEIIHTEIGLILSGRADELPPPQPFRNLVAEVRLGTSEEAHERFFRARLGDIDEPTTPFGLADVHRDGTSIAEARRTLPATLTERVRAQARRVGVSLASLCHLAWGLVVARTSGREQVVFGTVMYGRSQAGASIDRAMGLYINTLPLRLDIDEDTVEDSVRKAHRALAELMQHEHAPLSLAQRCSGVPAPTPLFSALLNYRHNRFLATGHDDHPLRDVEWREGEDRTNYPLVISVEDGGETLGLTVEASEPISSDQVCDLMQRAIEQLTDALEQGAQTSLCLLDVLPPAERTRVLETWNQTASPYPGRCIHELIEAQVDRAPDAIAIVFEGAQLSYRELDRRANQLARHLRVAGIGPESRVGLCVNRSLDMVVGVLGILKAGGAYVPIDPRYPQERLDFILDDTAVSVVVTHDHLAAQVRRAGTQIVRLDADWPEISELSDDRLDPVSSPSDLAYVIYTSGSTGKPKGVQIEHRHVVNHAWGWGSYERLGPDDRVLQLATLSFDGSVLEIFPALFFGSALVLRGEHIPTGAELFGAELAGVSVMFLTTSYFHALAGHPPPPALRFVSFGGDRVLPEHVRTWLELAPACELHHVYGPTECTALTTAMHLHPGDVSAHTRDVPIGQPLPNYQVYVLDPRRQPVPVGVAGELYIAGDSISRGYLHRPELTEERFVENPFGPGRMYRTGDFVRWSATGVIEFIGRVDNQVKLRGFRVELGEIEAALAQHPSVSEAIVIVRTDAGGDKRLVAYVACGQSSADEDALRAFVLERLPDYMVPARIIPLARFPLNPNGKVDKKALPEEAPSGRRGGDYEAPRTPIELELAGLWASLLRVAQVGRNDSFFSLGGHSLLGTRLVSLIRQTFQVDVSLRVVFESPTIAALAEQIARATGDAAPPIEPVSREHELEASFGQQRLWFLAQLEKHDAYDMSQALRLSGELDVEALGRALSTIVARHEVLRTTFVEREGRPIQKISPPSERELPIIDVASYDDALARCVESSQRRFDLSAHLFDPVLFRISPRDHVLLLRMHHIVGDEWSLGVLYDELAALYVGRELPPLKVQYADFAVWQRAWLTGDVLDRQLAYWRDHLAGVAPFELPTDRPRPTVAASQGARVELQLPGELMGAIEALCQDHAATPFITLLAAFYVLLHRYTQQDDICVGTPIANRSRAETETLIGFFVNTLALRVDLSGNPSFATLLERVRHAALSGYAHQDLPFERVVQELHPDRGRSHSPLFRVMFVVNRAEQMPAVPGLELDEIYLGEGPSQFDLTLEVEMGAAGMKLGIEFDPELFDAMTMERLLGHYHVLLVGIVKDPAVEIHDLPIMREDELHQILVAWNDTARDVPRDRCIHQLFEAQVDGRPDALAVLFDGQRLTYAELDRRANQLARHLLALGVGPEVRVGICLERTLDMVIGVLGVLKAGGAYVPLDAKNPTDRLGFIAKDAGLTVVLVHDRLASRLPDVQLVRLDLDAAKISAHSESRPASASRPEHLAYVIYTSGSTGQPKGVEVEHRMVVNEVIGLGALEKIEPSDRVLQFASLAFDASVEELFIPLVHGAAMVVRGEDIPTASELFGVWFEGVTVMNMATAYWHALAADAAPPASLRLVVIGGERALPEHVRAWLDHAPTCVLLNTYGPTETTVTATAWQLRREQLYPGREVPIGVPLPNYTAYVLDGQRQPVPIGVVGELYIGGDGVARGYLDRPELTADRFLANPFGSGRLYRTGDRVCWLADGNLEFKGRVDQQVKIHGFRIEPGEIETVLAEHPHVREVAVLARAAPAGDTYLIAYVSTTEEVVPNDLRAFVRGRLPEYMVPARVIVVDHMPLTPNGKIDTTRLPEDVAAPSVSGGEVPRTALELQLAELWARLLGRDLVQRHDNFFELGGHSLLAMRLVAQIRQALAIELTVRNLFESPTVAELASTIERATGDAGPPIEVVSRGADLEASFGQQRMWLVAQFGDRDAYDMSTALRIVGELDVGELARALASIVTRHEALRTTFAEVGGRLLQRIAPPREYELRVIEVASYDQAVAHCQDASQRPYDLSSGPVFEPLLLRVGPDDHVLFLRIHHIASDEWSTGVMLDELAQLYQGHTLPPLRIQYADFAAWQRARLAGVLDRQLAYWRDRLAGAPARLELPTDRPRPAVLSSNGAHVEARLSLELRRAVEKLGLEQSVTPFMTLLAAFQILLHRYTGEHAICVGTPVANRDQLGTEGLIGFFLNTVVLCTDLSGTPTFSEVLARVREAALGAFAHQDVPFDRVVEELQPDRDPTQTPLFQVMFVFQRAESPRGIPGLDLEQIDLVSKSAKFELTLVIQERSDGLDLMFEYNTDLFDAGTITRMLGHYRRLLEALVAEPSRKIGEIAIIDDDERRRLVAGNDPVKTYSSQRCLHELFEAQVDEHPDAPAVWQDGVSLTYGELDQRANRLARHLVDLGVGPDVLVAMLVDRSLEMIVGILGVLKAGGAYVPLDPSYPADRLAFMMSDAAPRVVLTHASLVASLPPTEARVVLLEDDLLRSGSAERVAGRVTPNHLAYVIYTSGSTGRPKGVQITHGNVTRLFAATWDWYRFDERDVWTLFHSYAFDFSVWEIWGALLYGGRLVVVPHLTSRSPDEFRELLSTQHVTVLNQTPSAFYELVHADQRASSPLSLRLVIFGGEALNFQKLDPWFHRHGDRHPLLVNMYGITETTVHVTYRPITATDLQSAANSAIGRPIPDLQLFVLDRNMQLAPIGVAGELYVGGHGLARGYLNRPELTEQRFVPNPFGEGRLYKTGDLARWLPDGELDYLGRIDQQVKIRGFRIELGEIEAVLGDHPSIREVAVLAREDQPGDKQLVAYVVQHDDTEVSELRAYARSKLPDHMVPSAFVVLASFPLTTNGKLDRKALPAPGGNAVVQRAYIAPSGGSEQTLAAVWCELLGLERVGRHDHFFELGGHSLLAIRLVDQLRRRGLAIELRNLFAAPTLADLAATLRSHREVHIPPNVIRAGAEITPDQLPLISLELREIQRIVAQVPGGAPNVQDIYALSPLQEGMLFHHQLAVEGDPYQLRELMVFPDRELLDRYMRAVQQVVDRHDILRTAFVWEGLSTPAQVVWREARLVITEIQLEPDGPSGRAQLEGRFDPRRHRMDLTQAPLLRFVIAQEPRSERWLAVAISHHMIDDYSTLAIMNAEVEAILDGRGHELARPVQFRNLVARALNGLSTEEHEQFFRSLLADIDEPTIPFGLSDVHRDGTSVGEAERRLSPALHQRLRAQARRLGVSLASLCHLAWGQVIARASGRERVVFGTVLFGRMQFGASDTAMGPYINTLPLRLDLDGTGVEDRARRTHALLGALLQHEHAPLPLAMRCSHVPPGAPLFTALLNYRNHSWGLEPDANQTLPIEWVEAEERTNYPLALSVDELVDALSLTAQVASPVSPERVCDMMERALDQLAEALERTPGMPVRALDVLPASERKLAYWRDHLRGAPVRLELPTDRPRPAVLGSRISTLECVVPQELGRALDALAQEHGATLFTALLAAFQVLVHRYTGEHDICVGTRMAARRDDSSSLNTVVIRAELSEAPSLIQVLGLVRDAVTSAAAHAEVPLDRVIEELRPDHPADQPFLQLLFGLRDAARPPGFDGSDLEVAATFELTLLVEVRPEGLACMFGYNTDLFDAGTIARMLGHYRRLLEGVVADPTQRVSEIPMITSAEEQQLAAWNATEREFDRDATIGALFEAQVTRSPEAIAVELGSERITYRELDRRAREVAGTLQAIGVGPGAFVGICATRSVGMVVGLVAILQVGAAYVPLDPRYPAARLHEVIADAAMAAIVVDAVGQHALGPTAVTQVELGVSAGSAGAGATMGAGSSAEGPAYVIYTSGSTGRPKGVVISHRSLVNHLRWQVAEFGFSASDVYLQRTSISFDASVWELWTPLTTGARLVLLSPELESSASGITETIRHHGVTIAQFVPSLLRLVLEADDPPLACDFLFSGGEALDPELTELARSRARRAFVNLYGPTEATIDATSWTCPPAGHGEVPAIIPIGRPVANAKARVLDGHRQQVPIGVFGELYLGGVGVATEYVGRPELTRERFVPDPFGDGRLYRTGDRVRWRSDGQLEYVGRLDSQVKLRGFRIELGEIESCLATNPHVREVAVIVRGSGDDKRLVAYVVGDGSLVADELSTFLQVRLPHYMVPTRFVALEQLPRLPNKKLDRSALPEDGAAPVRVNVRLARTRTELEVARIAAGLLRVSVVALDDNFFALGGHSLLATRFVAQVHERLGVRLPLAALFRAPTIEDLARLIDEHTPASSPGQLVPLQATGSRTRLVCIHPVGGTVFCYQQLAARVARDRACDAFEARGLDGQLPVGSIPEMAKRYVDELIEVRGSGPVHLLGWSFGGAVALEMTARLTAAGIAVASTTLIDSYAPATFQGETTDAAAIYAMLASDLGLDIDEAQLRAIGPDAARDLVIERAHEAGVLPAHVGGEELAARARVIDVHARALRDYVPSRSDARVILIKAAQGESSDPSNGWAEYLPNLELHVSPGDHYSMFQPPNLEALCACVEVVLENER